MMTGKKPLLIIGLVVLVFAVSQTLLFAGGVGPEPGSGCGEDLGLKYVAPPYIGDVSVALGDNDFYSIEGTISQVGNSGCTADLTSLEPYGPIEPEVFSSLKANDLRGTCLYEGITINIDCPDNFQNQYEVVGAGNLKYISPTVFTLHVVVMGLE